MKNILITGATGGIGHALVKTFFQNGYNICGSGTSLEKLKKLESSYKDRFKGLQCDLSDDQQIINLVQDANEYFGNINVLVNNAGITKDNLFMRMKENEWQNVIDINLKATFRLSQIVIKDMIKSKWGRVINITSDAAKIGNPGQANYVASKSAVEGLTRTIANEVASRGITVNGVSPGFIETDIIDTIDKKRLDMMMSKVPLGRMGKPEEVASLVYFLSSQESSYITGQILHINGGLTM